MAWSPLARESAAVIVMVRRLRIALQTMRETVEHAHEVDPMVLEILLNMRGEFIGEGAFSVMKQWATAGMAGESYFSQLEQSCHRCVRHLDQDILTARQLMYSAQHKGVGKYDTANNMVTQRFLQAIQGLLSPYNAIVIALVFSHFLIGILVASNPRHGPIEVYARHSLALHLTCRHPSRPRYSSPPCSSLSHPSHTQRMAGFVQSFADFAPHLRASEAAWEGAITIRQALAQFPLWDKVRSLAVRVLIIRSCPCRSLKASIGAVALQLCRLDTNTPAWPALVP